jgi:Mn2+/Fe2+ NRAMP family transporter
LVWQLVSGLPYRPLVAGTFVLLTLAVWFLPFKWIERVFGLLGLLMIVFVAAAVASKPDWQQVSGGIIPQLPKAATSSEMWLYAYFSVALFSSIVVALRDILLCLRCH